MNEIINQDELGKNEEINQEYVLQKSFSLKGKSVFSILANVFVGIFLVAGLVVMFFIFDFYFGDLRQFLSMLLWLLIGLGVVLIINVLVFVFKMILTKKFGGGKTKLHVGAFIEISSQNPVSKAVYLISDMIILIPSFILLAVLSIFFWNILFYITLLFLVVFLIPNVFLWIFIARQPKNSLFKFEKGILGSYKQNSLLL